MATCVESTEDISESEEDPAVGDETGIDQVEEEEDGKEDEDDEDDEEEEEEEEEESRGEDEVDWTKLSDYDTWMSRLPRAYHNVPLNALAIPGSHDSFAFKLDKKAAAAPDVHKTAFGKIANGRMKLMKKSVKQIMWKWSITQTLDFNGQLKAGIRYFDLRLAYIDAGPKDKPPSDPKEQHEWHQNRIHFVHGLIGLKLKRALETFKAFLSDDKHSKEVLILHFQHLYNFNDKRHTLCQSMIADYFGHKLCPSSADASTITLSSLWEKGHQVICLYNHHIQDGDPSQFWPVKMIQSPWPNVAQANQLVDKLDKNCDKPVDYKKFRVSQGVLTPNTAMILKKVGGNLKNQCAKKAAKPVVDWIRKKKPGSHGLNICIIDFIEMENFVPSVLQLNRL